MRGVSDIRPYPSSIHPRAKNPIEAVRAVMRTRRVDFGTTFRPTTRNPRTSNARASVACSGRPETVHGAFESRKRTPTKLERRSRLFKFIERLYIDVISKYRAKNETTDGKYVVRELFVRSGGCQFSVSSSNMPRP